MLCTERDRYALSRNLPCAGFLWSFFLIIINFSWNVDRCICSLFALSFFLQQGKIQVSRNFCYCNSQACLSHRYFITIKCHWSEPSLCFLLLMGMLFMLGRLVHLTILPLKAKHDERTNHELTVQEHATQKIRIMSCRIMEYNLLSESLPSSFALILDNYWGVNRDKCVFSGWLHAGEATGQSSCWWMVLFSIQSGVVFTLNTRLH